MHRARSLVQHIALVALLIVPTFGICRAADPADEAPAATSESGNTWEFEMQAPVWIPGNYGSLEVKGHTAAIDVSPKDFLDIATSGNAFAGAGYFEFRYDRFFTYADALGGYVDESVNETVPTSRFPRLSGVDVDAKLKMKQVMADFGVGYRLGRWTLPNRRRPISLGLYAGLRYYWFETRLRASAAATVGFRRRSIDVHRATDVSDTFDWADPLIGLRWEVPVLDCVSAEFRGDIGGFEAGSDLSWNLIGGFRYWVPFQLLSAQPSVGAGYRALAFDRSAGSSAELDLQFRGPYLSMGVVF